MILASVQFLANFPSIAFAMPASVASLESPQVSHQAWCASTDKCSPQTAQEAETWKGKVRVKALRNMDQLLNWSFGALGKSFPLVQPIHEERIEVDIPEIRGFVEKHGYFSSTRPIVSKVTSDQDDLELTCCLLKTLYEKGTKGAYLEIATIEVLTKILAYRDLKVGQHIHIPIESDGIVAYESFIVDQVFDIWHGMPAFGLIPEKQRLSSILLFRGSEFSLITQRGWASLISDLDPAGPGLSAFQHAQAKISDWLQKVMKLKKGARAMGFSLGGALAAYTYIYENAWVSKAGSVALCAPGVAEKVFEDWRSLSIERQKGFKSYVNSGDIVSKVGKLFGTVYCLSTAIVYKPLTAHTMLMCGEPVFSKALVDVEFTETKGVSIPKVIQK
jgi:hypothetical protein